MCKILAFTNTKKIKTIKTINTVADIITDEERDGFGYSILGSHGQYGEKSLDLYFRSRLNVTNQIDIDVFKRKYEMFGKRGKNVGPGIFHGRTSTNVKGLLNCHPMQMQGWSLIHNGVVDDLGPKYTKATQNDSEDVLFRLIQGIQAVERYLEGYYAFAAIDPEGKLHIAKDSCADLFMAWSQSLDSYVFGTTVELITDMAKKLEISLSVIEEVKDDIYMIFEGNNLISRQDIKPLGFSRKQSAHAEKSLGKTIGDAEEWSYREALAKDWDEHYWQERMAKEEDQYYEYKREIENMDASYEIYDADNIPMSLQEYRMLTHIEQEQCTIIRPDGTILDPYEKELAKRAS